MKIPTRLRGYRHIWVSSSWFQLQRPPSADLAQSEMWQGSLAELQHKNVALPPHIPHVCLKQIQAPTTPIDLTDQKNPPLWYLTTWKGNPGSWNQLRLEIRTSIFQGRYQNVKAHSLVLPITTDMGKERIVVWCKFFWYVSLLSCAWLPGIKHPAEHKQARLWVNMPKVAFVQQRTEWSTLAAKALAQHLKSLKLNSDETGLTSHKWLIVISGCGECDTDHNPGVAGIRPAKFGLQVGTP